jgi:hypothetical protein
MLWIPVSIVAILALFARHDRKVQHVSFDLLVSIASCWAFALQAFALFLAPSWFSSALDHPLSLIAISAPFFMIAAACFYAIYRVLKHQ